jgi:hypothetical protein
VLGAVGLGVSPARAEDTCTGQVVDIVDFSKAPNAVEGQNKVRVAINPVVDEKTHALSIEVQGAAYYPDGVTIFLGLRHWKSQDFFAKTRIIVKDRVFTHTFGPFQKKIPGGGLVVEARFYLSDQKPDTKAQLVREHFFHCNPPCDHDQRNRTEVSYSNGGVGAQDQAAQAEKEEIEKARKKLVDAQTVAAAAIAEIEAKKKGPDTAKAALDRLEIDLTAAVNEYEAWCKRQEFLLFQRRRTQLTTLKSKMTSSLKARAVLAGATVPGLGTGGAGAQLQVTTDDAKALVEDLLGFYAEKDSLEKAYRTDEKKGTNPVTDTPPPGTKPAAPAPTPPKDDKKPADDKPADPPK